MNYLINDSVVYRDDDGAMWKVDAPENVSLLPTTAARILAYLLENANSNVVISREDIFEHIWSQHGLQASNNTLNQYISLIRKTFLEMECEDEIIKTVPRLGFIVTANIIKSEPQNTPTSNTTQIEIKEKNKISYFNWKKPKLKIAIFCFILSLLYFGDTVYDILIQSRYKLENADTEVIGQYKDCSVSTFFRSSPAQYNAKIKRLENISNQYKLLCINNSSYYFHIENMFNNNPRFFLSRCTLVNGNPKHISACITVYNGGD